MKPTIIFWGNGDRGLPCYKKICEQGYPILAAVLHPQTESKWHASLKEVLDNDGIEWIAPENPNSDEVLKFLTRKKADLFVLAGYGKMLQKPIYSIPNLLCLNLHGGQLPKYRGSSPLNWALINGEREFGLSILEVTGVVDGGRIILERRFPIHSEDTINELHHKAAHEFPDMLATALHMISVGDYSLTAQDETSASYYPLRFPNDGFILFDQLTAMELHNRIRALTAPYPCAFTFHRGRKVKLISSAIHHIPFYGEPGRIYQKCDRGLLVCCKDVCLWLKEAIYEGSDEKLFDHVSRYDTLPTLKGAALELLEKRV